MESGGAEEEDTPIGDLVDRLIDQGKDYARAEVGLVKAKAEATVDRVKLPALMLGAAFLFLQAGVVLLCMTLALALATLIGPLAGGLFATVVALGIAAALALVAKRRMAGR